MDEVPGLLDQAIELLGRKAVIHETRAIARGDPGHSHPWSGALEWHLRVRDSRLVLPVDPRALLVARDVRYLKTLTEVWDDPALLARTRQRMHEEGDRAIWEMRVAALYRDAGFGSDWTELTNPTAGPDVMILDPEVEVQVKVRQGQACATPMLC